LLLNSSCVTPWGDMFCRFWIWFSQECEVSASHFNWLERLQHICYWASYFHNFLWGKFIFTRKTTTLGWQC